MSSITPCITAGLEPDFVLPEGSLFRFVLPQKPQLHAVYPPEIQVIQNADKVGV